MGTKARIGRSQGALTLGAVVDAYLAELAMRAKPSTIKAARSALAVLQRELPGFPDRDNLEAWRRARVAQGRSNRTVNRDMTTLGAALAFALDRGWIKANPVRLLRRLPQKGRHRRRIVTRREKRRGARMRAALLLRPVFDCEAFSALFVVNEYAPEIVFRNGSSIAFGPVEDPLISTDTRLLWDPTQESP